MNHRQTFRSIIDMTIDLFSSEDRYSAWNTTASLCVYNPDHICDLACECPDFTLARHRSLNLWPESNNRYSNFTVPSSHHISNNRLYVQFHLFAGTDSIAIDLRTMEDWLFSLHRSPTILPFLLVACCDCRWLRNDVAFHMLRTICHIKNIITIYFHIWT